MGYQNITELLWLERFFKLVLWILLATSVAMTIFYGAKFMSEKTVIEKRISDTYKVPLESAHSLQCYQGYLHYPNQGNFSGLLAFTPNIPCNAKELSALSSNQYSPWLKTYGLLSLVAIVLLRLMRT
ncbi:MAG: hypothetical protein IE914_04075 [Thiotrichales bacterium]|nr:hypothetical protein [Thiotrichales bacterium]